VERIAVALQVVTFDHNGASGHANHIQTSKGTIAVVNVAKHKLQLLLLVRINTVYDFCPMPATQLSLN
jgi:LmbE family N-acetylglucosaminyl deacetylase